MLSRAIKLAAKKSRHKMHKHAVLVLKSSNIIAIGVNHEEVHAEISALKKLSPQRRKGTKIISIRLRRGGVLGLAKPCKECEKFLRDNGVQAVTYSNNDGSMTTEYY